MSRTVWIVRNGHSQVGPKYAVVFDNDDHLIDRIQFYPDPVVVAVDVDAQESDFTGKASFAQEFVDIIARDPGASRGESVAPIDFAFLNLTDALFIAVQNDAAPVVIQQ